MGPEWTTPDSLIHLPELACCGVDDSVDDRYHLIAIENRWKNSKKAKKNLTNVDQRQLLNDGPADKFDRTEMRTVSPRVTIDEIAVTIGLEHWRLFDRLATVARRTC